MFIFGGIFESRIHKEINALEDKYNPDNIKFRLITYTYYEAGEKRYNPSIKEFTTNESARENLTSGEEITPEELYDRIQFLAKFDFRITKYQYDCEIQRALMTPELRREVILRDKSICQICGKNCDYKDIEIDHIQPISKGGKTILSNLQVLCVKCNRSKSNKWLESFTDLKTKYHESKEATSEYENVGIKKNKYQPKNHFKYDKNGNMEIHNHMRKVEGPEDKNVGTAQKQFSMNNDRNNNFSIKWIKVESSNILQIYYNINAMSLYVMFNNSDIYVYYNVEGHVFMEFLSAPSKGSYVRSELYRYDYKKIAIEDVK